MDIMIGSGYYWCREDDGDIANELNRAGRSIRHYSEFRAVLRFCVCWVLADAFSALLRVVTTENPNSLDLSSGLLLA